MLVVVSPAKNLDFETEIPVSTFTQPTMMDDTSVLWKCVERCRQQTYRH